MHTCPETGTAPARPRVAVVLGAAVWHGGVPSPTLARRARHAAGLWHAGKVDVIIGCGGLGAHPPSEAHVIAALCRAEGVPQAALINEDRSACTRTNLRYAQPLLDRLNPGAVILVTDPYHAPRARLIARQLGLHVQTDCPPRQAIGPRQWLRHIPREALALLAVLFRLR
ncbi:MAG: YdcF family protein [Pararhodobacter sp.]|nr:YdcF family protein [Pararhodobacter sp.]